MNKILILFSFLISLGSNNAAAFDFKGLHIGSNTSAAQVYQYLGINCDRHNAGEEFICSGYTTIADVKSFILVRVGADSICKVISLTFDAEEFSKVESSLIHKFGKPKSENSIVQNKMGASFNQTRHLWKKDGNELIAEKFGNTIDRSYVGFLSKSALAEAEKEASTPSNDL